MLGPRSFDYQKPNASYFVFPRIKDTVPLARDSRRLAAEILARARVALVPGVAFGPTGQAHLRFCYARSSDDIHRAFDRLDDYFAGRPSRIEGERVTVHAADPPGAHRAGLALLRHGARAHLARTRPRVVAIAGTRGKTVMKRTLSELLARRLRVRANPLSYNTAIGLPLAVLGRTIETRPATRLVRGLAGALRTAYAGQEPVDVMVLEFGVRRPGDVRRHLEVVRPDIVVVAPLAPSFSQEVDALATLRAEIETLCAGMRPRTLLLCEDDPFLADMASRMPGATRFGSRDVEHADDGLVLHVEDMVWPVGRDTVGASGLRALSVAARVGRLVGLSDADVATFLKAS
jgi:UDP-N-acetylmuramyl pentapeptide synthase